MARRERAREHQAQADRPAPERAREPELAAAQVLALQRTAGNQAVGRALARRVRLGGGATKPDGKYYTTGKGKDIGSRRKVSSLLNDRVKRIFTDQAELESYADGATDYIGDVKTTSAGKFWYRLPQNSLTILGEIHHDDQGNVPDVIKAFGTNRFMYEPFNELVPTRRCRSPRRARRRGWTRPTRASRSPGRSTASSSTPTSRTS